MKQRTLTNVYTKASASSLRTNEDTFFSSDVSAYYSQYEWEVRQILYDSYAISDVLKLVAPTVGKLVFTVEYVI